MSSASTCDTSVVVAALLAWHPLHHEAATALRDARGLVAHVLLETYSVLTRLPAPHRVDAALAGRALANLTVPVLELPGPEQAALVASLPALGVRGGATYDALVAATARHHEVLLVSADLRARRVYEGLGVTALMIGTDVSGPGGR